MKTQEDLPFLNIPTDIFTENYIKELTTGGLYEKRIY